MVNTSEQYSLNYMEEAFLDFLEVGREKWRGKLEVRVIWAAVISHPPFVSLKSMWKRLDILFLEK